MKLNNVRQIRAEDFDPQYANLVSGMGSILNSFMQEVVELADKRIDFDNKTENLITFQVTVDDKGVPVQSPFRVNTGKGRILGFQIISARNLTNLSGFPTSQPFVSYQPQGNGIATVQNITGLRPNERYEIVAIVY